MRLCRLQTQGKQFQIDIIISARENPNKQWKISTLWLKVEVL